MKRLNIYNFNIYENLENNNYNRKQKSVNVFKNCIFQMPDQLLCYIVEKLYKPRCITIILCVCVCAYVCVGVYIYYYILDIV